MFQAACIVGEITIPWLIAFPTRQKAQNFLDKMGVDGVIIELH